MIISRKKSAFILSVIAYLLVFSIHGNAQTPASKTNTRTLDKSMLVIHGNFRDDLPQHYNNGRTSVTQVMNTNHSRSSKKLSKTNYVHSGNTKTTEFKDSGTKSLKSKRSHHKSTRKRRKHN